MSLSLNNTKLMSTMLPALAVMAGVFIKNGSEQLYKGIYNKGAVSLGSLLFIGGWIGIAWAVSQGKSGNEMWYPVVASGAILLSVLGMGWMKNKYGAESVQKQEYKLLGLLFVLGWLALGWSVAMGKSQNAMYFGIGAAVLVLLSMLFVLPWQRMNGVVDGPGIGLFVLGWVFLAVANSMGSNTVSFAFY